MTKLLPLFLTMLFVTNLYASCEVVEGGKKTPFNGKDIAGMSIEKKSLSLLNKEFPNLGVIEKSFKGEVQTCTSCSDKFITCSN